MKRSLPIVGWGHRFALVCVVMLSLLVSLGHAQGPANATSSGSAEALMADQLVRLAGRILGRDSAAVSEDRLIRAGLLVDLAIGANPADADAWMFRKRLATLAGDDEAVMDALGQYCRLRPDDDAAQYDLIMATIEKNQTLEARAAAVERALETQSASELSDAVQSRLASYLAQAAREAGDEQRFGKWLKAAVQLDPSNRHAARLIYDLAVTRGASDLSVGQALLQMIAADPLDDMARHMLADLLASCGNYEAAERQYRIASTFGVKEGGDQFLKNWVLCLAAVGRSSDMLDMLDSLGYKAKQADAKAIPLEIQILRLAVLSQDNRTEEALASFKQVRVYFQQRVDMGDVDAALELAWWTAMFGPRISPGFEKAVLSYANANPGKPLIQRTLGWVYYRTGRIEEAANVLHLLAESDPWAVYGLAKCAATEGGELYTGYLQKVIRMDGTHPAAMLAARDLTASGTTPEIAASNQRLVAAMEQLPANVMTPSMSRNTWTMLDISITPTVYTYLDPIIATVKLRNLTDMPLGLGPKATIPTNLQIYLSPWRGGQPVAGIAPIEVDLRQTLSLKARETLSVPVRLDRGELGLLLSQNPAASIGFSVTAMLDPIPSPDGQGLTTGPLGGYALIKFVDRRAVRPTSDQVDAWLASFKAPTDALSHMKLIARLCRLMDSLNAMGKTKNEAARIAQAVNDQFANLGSLGQAWTVLFAPGGPQGQQLVPNVHQLARQSNDPLVRIAYLAVHGQSDDAVVRASANHADPRINAFAKALMQTQATTQPANE